MPYQICKRCIMDTTDPTITFDENGYCNKCTRALELLNSYPLNLSSQQKQQELERKIEEIKSKGKGKSYDAIIGISGGVDSSYVAVLAKQYGLRILAFHLDNGWNSEIAVNNIYNLVKKLNIELYTEVLDWEEFRDLQLSFLKASVPDLEIPTDHAIIAALYKIAKKFNIPTVISGHNTITESIGSPYWSNGHYDWIYIQNIQKKFGTRKLKKFPHLTPYEVFKIFTLRGFKRFEILNFVDYDKKKVLEMLKKEYQYKEYNTKHGESIYTHFVQSYVLPKKFGYDKRKAHLSNLIISGQISRKEALEILKQPLFTPQDEQELLEYVANKLEISVDYLQELLSLPNKHYFDYLNYNNHRLWGSVKKFYNKIFNK